MSTRPRKEKPRSVTIIDVARAANVSYSTVSRVINDATRVRADKRQRVLDAMTRLGYVANAQARSLAGGRSRVIGLLVPDLGNSYIGEIARGVDDALAAADHDLMLHTTHHLKSKELMYARQLVSGLIDGLLLLVPLDPSAYVESLYEAQFPYVVIDHQGFDDFSPTVSATNWQGAYDAMRYLLKLGHRRVGFLAGQPDLSSAHERLSAYRAALMDCGILFDPALVADANFQQAPGYGAALALLDLPEPPTAIFAANDLSAYGAMDAARSRGLVIPRDISIIGFDDLPQSGSIRPALTTVRQPLFEMGQQATRLLLDYINDPTRPTERLVMPTELVIRESCAPPKIINE
jgi:LacI family transcriptional regulator